MTNTYLTSSKLSPLLLLSFCVALSSCGNVRDQLGITKNAPDEFAVVTRAPLEMPPSMVLPPPQPGKQRPQENSPQENAKEAVFGTKNASAQTASQSASESALLEKTGHNQIDPNIRDIVEQDAIEDEKRSKTVAQKLLGLGGKKVEPTAEVVDAPAEAKRIQDNLNNGKSVSEGETPSLER